MENITNLIVTLMENIFSLNGEREREKHTEQRVREKYKISTLPQPHIRRPSSRALIVPKTAFQHDVSFYFIIIIFFCVNLIYYLCNSMYSSALMLLLMLFGVCVYVWCDMRYREKTDKLKRILILLL